MKFFFPIILLFENIQLFKTENNFPFFLKNTTLKNNAEFDPCKDFYNFACIQWLSDAKKPDWEPVWNPWLEVSHEINAKLRNLLENGIGDDFALKQARKFYKICSSVSEHLKELNQLLESFGKWPMTNPDWSAKNFDWTTQIATITKLLAIHPIIKLKIDIDYANPEKYTLYMEPGDLIFPHDILTQPTKFGPELEAYEAWIIETVKIITPHHSKTLQNDAKDLIKFEIRLAELGTASKIRNLRTTISKLHRKSLNYNWLPAFRAFFNDFHQITSNSSITIRNFAYFRGLIKLIQKTSAKTIANYLIWSVVKDVARDVSPKMRNLNFRINSAVLGIKSDFPRSFECVAKTAEHFGPILAPFYVHTNLKPETFPIVSTMVAAIKNKLIAKIDTNRLISIEAKRLMSEKIDKIDAFIGFPHWYNDANQTQRFHIVHMADNHFFNVFLLKNFKMADELKKYGQRTKTEWPASCFDVNAYYSVLQNAIFIPLGLLHAPFFNPTHSNILNFGALGSLIGHELAHAIDPIGILADQNGKIGAWMPLSDLAALQNITKCYKKQQVSGKDVGEKMADDLGVDVSLATLSDLVKLETRAFFATFAGIWCEKAEEMDLFGDEHAPHMERVAVLMNNPQFIDAFNCDNNDENRCLVW